MHALRFPSRAPYFFHSPPKNADLALTHELVNHAAQGLLFGKARPHDPTEVVAGPCDRIPSRGCHIKRAFDEVRRLYRAVAGTDDAKRRDQHIMRILSITVLVIAMLENVPLPRPPLADARLNSLQRRLARFQRDHAPHVLDVFRARPVERIPASLRLPPFSAMPLDSERSCRLNPMVGNTLVPPDLHPIEDDTLPLALRPHVISPWAWFVEKLSDEDTGLDGSAWGDDGEVDLVDWEDGTERSVEYPDSEDGGESCYNDEAVAYVFLS
ncbi:hypothetical protein OF83DRAFT_625696 [Amylostereum chailletii]|nr:hypothetical protein OF83DRAFT_625696 [Amylostereum chailletii]